MKSVSSNLVWIFTLFLYVSFYLFETYSWGKYLIFIISGIIFIFAYSSGRKRIKIHPFHWFVLLFGIFCLLSSIWAKSFAMAFEKGITILSILLCFTFIYTYYEGKDIDSLLKVIMWGGYIIAMCSIFTYGGVANVTMMLLGGIKLDNMLLNVNTIGMTAAFACIIQAYYILDKKKSISILFAIPAIIIILATQSRKAFLLLIIGIFSMFIVKNMNNRGLIKRVIRIVVVVIVAIMLVKVLSLLPLFSYVNERLGGLWASITGNGQIDHSSYIRKEYRRVGMEQFFKTPILGIGIGCSSFISSLVEGRQTYLHNNFVELLACGGIVGFTLFYSMYLFLAAKLYKFRRYMQNQTWLCLILMFLMIVMDYGMVSYYSKGTYFFLMVFFIQYQNAKKSISNRNVYS